MNPVGRPLAFKTVKELQDKITEYFDWCDNRNRTIFDSKTNQEVVIIHPAPYTMSGLARRLGVSRQTLVNYSDKEEFFDTIREARARIEEDVETRMMETKNEKGAQFNLKNNFGWRDKSETELSGPDGQPLTTQVIVDGKGYLPPMGYVNVTSAGSDTGSTQVQSTDMAQTGEKDNNSTDGTNQTVTH